MSPYIGCLVCLPTPLTPFRLLTSPRDDYHDPFKLADCHNRHESSTSTSHVWKLRKYNAHAHWPAWAQGSAFRGFCTQGFSPRSRFWCVIRTYYSLLTSFGCPQTNYRGYQQLQLHLLHTLCRVSIILTHFPTPSPTLPSTTHPYI